MFMRPDEKRLIEKVQGLKFLVPDERIAKGNFPLIVGSLFTPLRRLIDAVVWVTSNSTKP